jgi:hypothetical protein
MAILQSIRGGLVHVDLTGHCPLPEVRAHLSAVLTDPAFRSDLPWIVECRDLTTLWPSEEVRAAATEMAARCTAPGRCALVADAAVVYGLLRMFEAFSDRGAVAVRAFRDREEALAWLSAGPSDSNE